MKVPFRKLVPKTWSKKISFSCLLGLFFALLIHLNLAFLGGWTPADQELTQKGEHQKEATSSRPDTSKPDTARDNPGQGNNGLNGDDPGEGDDGNGQNGNKMHTPVKLDRVLDADAEAKEAGGKAEKDRVPYDAALLGTSFLFLLILFLRASPFLSSSKSEEDKAYQDPPLLQNFFKNYRNEINELGTPRNVKRFCNKARLQLSLLMEEGNFQEEELLAYLELLLFVELYAGKTLARDRSEFIIKLERISGIKEDRFTRANQVISDREKKDQEADIGSRKVLKRFFEANYGGLA